MGLFSRFKTKLAIGALALTFSALSCSTPLGDYCSSNSQCEINKTDKYEEMCLDGVCVEKTGCYSEEDCPDFDRVCHETSHRLLLAHVPSYENRNPAGCYRQRPHDQRSPLHRCL